MLYYTRKNVFITTFQKRRQEKKRKEKERRRKEEKGVERRKDCPIEAILNNQSVKLFKESNRMLPEVLRYLLQTSTISSGAY